MATRPALNSNREPPHCSVEIRCGRGFQPPVAADRWLAMPLSLEERPR